MLETVRIRRAGYSVRFEYPAFVKQYRILLPRGDDSTRDDIENFVERHPIIETENVQYGTTKVFTYYSRQKGVNVERVNFDIIQKPEKL